jgi:uncharacterized membrane protein YedE/YeeE
MKKMLGRHWSYLPTAISLSLILILFWFFNQSYLGQNGGTIATILENPILTFGLILFGAYGGAIISGEFSVKLPLTFEPLVFAFIGGFLAGAGAVIAGMSANSVVLFNLAGVFTLTAFMVTIGWIYVAFMILGGFVGTRLLVWLIPKIPAVKREIPVPERLNSTRNHRLVFSIMSFVLTAAIVLILTIFKFSFSVKTGLIAAVLLLIVFGFVVERGTICMSSMLKEWFISKSAYVWRSVLATVMCLSLLYLVGLQLKLYDPVIVESYIKEPQLLMFGSFIMGFGFIFADGCFIGSLWKAGEGNVINIVGLFGLLMGIGLSQIVKDRFFNEAAIASGLIPNYLNTIINPLVLVIILWILGVLLLLFFKRKIYKY